MPFMKNIEISKYYIENQAILPWYHKSDSLENTDFSSYNQFLPDIFPDAQNLGGRPPVARTCLFG